MTDTLSARKKKIAWEGYNKSVLYLSFLNKEMWPYQPLLIQFHHTPNYILKPSYSKLFSHINHQGIPETHSKYEIEPGTRHLLHQGQGRATYLMHLIHSSFSSGVAADILYTVCLPSTTFPSLSVLQALMKSVEVAYNSKQFGLLRSCTSRTCEISSWIKYCHEAMSPITWCILWVLVHKITIFSLIRFNHHFHTTFWLDPIP